MFKLLKEHKVLFTILLISILSNLLIIGDYMKEEKYRNYYNHKVEINMKLFHNSLETNDEILKEIIKNNYFTKEQIKNLYYNNYTLYYSMEELYSLTRAITEPTRYVQTNSPTLLGFYFVRGIFSNGYKVRGMCSNHSMEYLNSFKGIYYNILSRKDNKFEIPQYVMKIFNSLYEVNTSYLNIINNYKEVWSDIENKNYLYNEDWVKPFIDIDDAYRRTLTI